MSFATECPVCGGSDLEPVFTLGNVPVVCNQLWPDADAARVAPTGDVDLVRCPHCASVWNAAFEPERMVYAPGYENALHFSPRFRAFADELAKGLVDRFGLKDRHVIEIGCGDGQMLELMSKHGAATAIGFDPSMAGKHTTATDRPGVEIVPELFGPDHLRRPFDFLVCRHVLEHLDQPAPFLAMLRRAIGDRDVPVYFEVPNAGWMFAATSLWDLIYEHVTYWTAPSLVAVFRRAGFEPVRVREGFGDQFLMLEAVPGKPDPGYLPGGTDKVEAAAEAFGRKAGERIAGWHAQLVQLPGPAVVWGAGSKGTTFVNTVGPDGKITALVDLNPRKHGLFVPGAAIPVIGPRMLAEVRPDHVFISNMLYADEITSMVAELGLAPGFTVIAGE